MIRLSVTAFVCLALFCASPRYARTYYIDFTSGNDRAPGTSKSEPWRHAPGMKGWSGSLRHVPGDTYVFRGGVTWPSLTLPFTIAHSGAPGKPDCYTADSAWFIGPVFKRPVINGGHVLNQLLVAERKSYFTINNIAFVDFGTAGKENGGKAIEMNACSHYTISRCLIAPEAWIGLYLHSFSGKTESGITVRDNDISCAAQAIVLATEAKNTIMREVLIAGNRIHDLSSQLVSEVHGDGIHTWNSPQTDNTQYLRDVRISENIFDGDYVRSSGTASMTAHIYITDPGRNYLVCNNVLTWDRATRFGALLWVRSADSVLIANNTIVLPATDGGIGIMLGEGDPSEHVRIVNNIIAGALQSYYLNPGTAATAHIDHNLIAPQKETIGWLETAFKNRAEWNSAGFDVHGIIGDAGVSVATRWIPAATSIGVGKGFDLSALFDNDAHGNKRIAPWDIGAFVPGAVPQNNLKKQPSE